MAKVKRKPAAKAKAKKTERARPKAAPARTAKPRHAPRDMVNPPPPPPPPPPVPATGRPLITTFFDPSTGTASESGIGIEAPPGVFFQSNSTIGSIGDKATGAPWLFIGVKFSLDKRIMYVGLASTSASSAVAPSGMLSITLLNVPGIVPRIDVAVDYIDDLP
jgi:hypothetical protein